MPPPKKKIEDVGEKIGGSRKDFYTHPLDNDDYGKMTPEEKQIFLKRDNIWPPKTWQELSEEGISFEMAYIRMYIQRLLAPAPNNAKFRTPMEGETYISLIQSIRTVVERHPTVAIPVDVVTEIREDGSTKTESLTFVEDWKRMTARISSGQLAAMTKSRSESSGLSPLKDALYYYRNSEKLLNIYYIAEESIPRQNLSWDKVLSDIEERKAARKKKTEDPVKAKIARPDLERLVVQKSYRDDRDISGEDLLAKFGFRGIEYGNWMSQEERQKSLNLAYDSFCAMTEIYHLPDDAISMNGTLALGFGSRGKGKANAHYEPGRRVINLTKPRGAGSLAHEWFHALDHYLGSLDGLNAMGFATERMMIGVPYTPSNEDTPPELSVLQNFDKRFHETVASLFGAVRVGIYKDGTINQDNAKSYDDELDGYRAWCMAKTAERSKALFDKVESTLPTEPSDQRVRVLMDLDDTLSSLKTMVESLPVKRLGERRDDYQKLDDVWKRLTEILTPHESATGLDASSTAGFLTAPGGRIAAPRFYSRADKKAWPYISSDYTENAFAIDKKKQSSELPSKLPPTSGYWSTFPEMGARAFETVTQTLAEAQGLRNDYLVNSTKRFPLLPGKDDPPSPYPSGLELDILTDFYANLMGAYEEHSRILLEKKSLHHGKKKDHAPSP